jgi:hypothetical protein
MSKIGFTILVLLASAQFGLAARADDVPGMAQVVPGLAAPTGGAGMYSNTNQLSYRNPFGMVPKFTPDYMNQFKTARLGTGTVLTGIMDDELSSKNAKAGKVFSIRLQDGFVDNGKELIPKQSKIVGTVISATPAKARRNGEAGQIDISLQTLVFPDGSHTRFSGDLDYNPANDQKHKPGSAPVDVANTARRSLGSLMTMVTGRVGMPIRGFYRSGLDLKIEKGQVVPIKVSRPVDLTRMTPSPQVVQTPYTAPMGSALPPQPAPPINQLPKGLAAPPAQSLGDTPGFSSITPEPTFVSSPGSTAGGINSMPDPF